MYLMLCAYAGRKVRVIMKRILVIGVGSILKTDDGIGPRVIDVLEKEDPIEGVKLERGDLSGMDLLKFFPDFKEVIIVDAADMGEKPGAVRVFKATEIEPSAFKDKFSTHGMALLETLTLARQIEMDTEITIVGVQPESTEFGLELTPGIKAKIPFIAGETKKLINAKQHGE